MNKEKLNLFKEKGKGVSKGKGYVAPSQRVLWQPLRAGVCSLYAASGRKLLSSVGFGGLVGGLGQWGWVNRKVDVGLGA